jgi:hypothetical protein
LITIMLSVFFFFTFSSMLPLTGILVNFHIHSFICRPLDQLKSTVFTIWHTHLSLLKLSVLLSFCFTEQFIPIYCSTFSFIYGTWLQNLICSQNFNMDKKYNQYWQQEELGKCSLYSDWLQAGRTSGQSSSLSRVKNSLFMSRQEALGPTRPPIQ